MQKSRVDLLQECVKRLAVEPNSLWRAKLLGGERWFGWDMNSDLLAALIDKTTFMTSATAVNKKAKLADKDRVERPKATAETRTYKPKSVKSMRLGAFFGSMIQQ